MKDSIDVPSAEALEIFGQAIDIESLVDRAAFVKQACGHNNDLLASVEALLKNHREVVSVPPVKNPIGEQVGDTIDKYELLREIGEGGCGVVYLAEQQKPLHRHVALKVIKPGMDTKQVVRRFEDERQALATLQHSSIAKVYDAGVTSFGRPYFVMEWVQGKRITDYADSHNLTIRLRLQLFIRVCKAVQYAHEKGIIHRDIKPSNILVAEENGEPLPKVIDFGIAKAMDVNEGTTTSINTRTGQLIGTPAYMSPEQASGNGTKIDKRSDIYSLGVLLYELLTGFGPLQLDALSLYHQLRAICDDDPELASEKVASLSATETLRIATTRSTQATQVIMELRSGVDAIVMRCLKKKAEDRYDTVTTLAADIAKWIDGHSKAVEPSEVASGCVKGMDSGLACLIAVVILVAVTVLVQSYNVPPPVVVKAPTPTNYLDKMKQQLLQWANYVRTNTFPQLTNLPTNPEKTIPHQAASLTKQDVERGDSVLAKTIDEIHGQQRQSLDSDDVATPNALLAKTIDAIE